MTSCGKQRQWPWYESFAGPTYEAWLDWAVCRGHTVGGVNLLQCLFSAEPGRRRRAIGCACTFLGSPDENALRAATPGLPADEEGLLLELARRLLDRGLLESRP